MNLYKTWRDQKQKKVDDYLREFAFFAFNENQFADGLKKLNISKEESPKLLSKLGNTGGFILKDKAKGFKELLDTADYEQDAAIHDPETGSQFALDMFRYELDNHEYSLTLDTEETLEALGYTWEDVQADPVLAIALREACEEIHKRKVEEADE
jgi:hypothetical protein